MLYPPLSQETPSFDLNTPWLNKEKPCLWGGKNRVSGSCFHRLLQELRWVWLKFLPPPYKYSRSHFLSPLCRVFFSWLPKRLIEVKMCVQYTEPLGRERVSGNTKKHPLYLKGSLKIEELLGQGQLGTGSLTLILLLVKPDTSRSNLIVNALWSHWPVILF